jgi:hypothetical protein
MNRNNERLVLRDERERERERGSVMSYGLELCELKKERVMRMCVRKSVCVYVYVCVNV